MSHQTPGIKHLFPNTQIMQFQCDDIWRRVDQLDFRFGDELTSRPRRRDDQGDELTCNPCGGFGGAHPRKFRNMKCSRSDSRPILGLLLL